MRRQAAGIAHQVGMRQGHDGGQLLQKFQRREFNAGGAVGSRPGKSVNELPVRVLFEPLKRHSPSACVSNQALQLVTPMRRNIGVG